MTILGKPPAKRLRRFWTTLGDKILYQGYDIEAARSALVPEAVIKDGGDVYPEPQFVPECTCKIAGKAASCPTGHVGECHWPLSCSEADCCFLRAWKQEDKDELMEKLSILATDVEFPDSPDAGPMCGCSRCGRAIMEEPVRIEEFEGGEYRFHRACL